MFVLYLSIGNNTLFFPLFFTIIFIIFLVMMVWREEIFAKDINSRIKQKNDK